jgi:hypothetical protein
MLPVEFRTIFLIEPSSICWNINGTGKQSDMVAIFIALGVVLVARLVVISELEQASADCGPL